MKRELLVTITSGNLKLDRSLSQDQAIYLDGDEWGRSRLLDLLGAQPSFGGAIGSHVLFFFGAFIDTILDLLNDPSSEDEA